MIPLKIASIENYQPDNWVDSKEFDQHFKKPNGWCIKKSGVHKRAFAKNETSSYMGAMAAIKAINSANIEKDEIDCIISASGIMEQAIPVTSILIKQQLGITTPIPCFDLNVTCMGFVLALDIAGHYLDSGTYNRILIVSSEIPSKGISPKDPETYTIFGDGAAAAIVMKTPDAESSILLDTRLENHLEGINHCVLEGLGTKYSPAFESCDFEKTHLFQMEGRKIFKLVSKVLPPFIDTFLTKNHLTKKDIDLVIPHQASGLALLNMRKRLKFPEEKVLNVISTLGNQMSASIPSAMALAKRDGRLKRGQTILLIGTAAGLTIGASLLRY